MNIKNDDGCVELEESFVPEKKQKVLRDNGWKLTFNCFTQKPVNKMFPDGKSGLQKWVKSHYELYVYYCPDGKHYICLFDGPGDKDSVKFTLRNIVSMLKRRELIN